MTDTSPISDTERQTREWNVAQARASSELEGIHTSPQMRAVEDQWARGELSVETLEHQLDQLTHAERAAARTA